MSHDFGLLATTLSLKAPLDTAWTEQLCTLELPWEEHWAHASVRLNGRQVPAQRVGEPKGGKAPVLLRLGFQAGEEITVETGPSPALEATEYGEWLRQTGTGFDLVLPWCTASFAFPGSVHTRSLSITRVASGPLFETYRVEAGEKERYRMELSFFPGEELVTISEWYNLERLARLVVGFRLAPSSLATHKGFDFEGEGPVEWSPFPVAPNEEDSLLRIQMPPIGEYVIPGNVGWFAMAGEDRAAAPGVMGLYGARWKSSCESLLHLFHRKGEVSLEGTLAQGERHWMLFRFRDEPEADGRMQVHRLIGEWNACPLAAHLDLGEPESLLRRGPFFYPEEAQTVGRESLRRNPALQAFLETDPPNPQGRQARNRMRIAALLEDDQTAMDSLREMIFWRFRLWVAQFQGHRRGLHDYEKNVIGFSRFLRGILLDIELLDQKGAWSAREKALLSNYLLFAGRRITDEGRWPHSRTWLHPLHPESTRRFYTYENEQVPDKLIWTNSLPNFQSDPMCALLHLSAILEETPEVLRWRSKGMEELERQFEGFCSRSGAWEESILYTIYTVSYFVITFRVAKRALGVDYFQDERFIRLLRTLVSLAATPLDPRFGVYSFPAMGNVRLPQGGGELLLACAAELPREHPLRPALVATGQRLSGDLYPNDYGPLIALTLPPFAPDEGCQPPLSSEVMEDLGVLMRGEGRDCRNLVIQKIGLFKDHYEGDETTVQWYAHGAPLIMDYGTYTGDVSRPNAHSILEVADQDDLRRGYLAKAHFSPGVDFTRCEVPVLQRFLYGEERSFAQIDHETRRTRHFYIGDHEPQGPLLWKTRQLWYVKPDYLVVRDELHGNAPHRLNWHVTAHSLEVCGNQVKAHGRFGVDLHAWIFSPGELRIETGELIPEPERLGEGEANPHRQKFFRTYSTRPVYLSLLFAGNAPAQVREPVPGCIEIVTERYRDFIVTGTEYQTIECEGFRFMGRCGWLRYHQGQGISCAVMDGSAIGTDETLWSGEGPWQWQSGSAQAELLGGPPRVVRKQGQTRQ